MAMRSEWILRLLAACFYLLSFVRANDGPVKCEDLGFTGLALSSDCDALAEFVKDEELVSDCRRCCAQEQEDSISKVSYSGAILEVCMRKLVFYPNVQSFIEDDLEKYTNIKVQYRFGSPPKLIMLDEDGNDKESLRSKQCFGKTSYPRVALLKEAAEYITWGLTLLNVSFGSAKKFELIKVLIGSRKHLQRP